MTNIFLESQEPLILILNYISFIKIFQHLLSKLKFFFLYNFQFRVIMNLFK